MKLKIILGVSLSVASLYLTAQQTQPKQVNTKINEKYLKHIQDAMKLHQKDIQFAKDNHQKPPEEYNLAEYIATMDPNTGQLHNQNYVNLEKDIKAGKYKADRNLEIFGGALPGANKAIPNQWTERGPYDIGGRIRGIMFDPNDASGKKVWAGGVSGGLWYNNDIADSNSEWTLVDGFWANTSISCIVSDPNNSQIFYVGTGEVETGDISGQGIWKTTDGGQTWNQIFTFEGAISGNVKNGNHHIPSIRVVNNNGVSEVYAGVSGTYLSDAMAFMGIGQSGLYKSTDGVNFTKLNNLLWNASNGYNIQDIEVGKDNAIWVATRRSSYSGQTSGGKIFKSTDFGATFTKVYDVGNVAARVMVEVSETNSQKAYALMQGATTSEPVRIVKTTDGGTTWISTNVAGSGITLPKPIDTGQPANDFTRGQSFYDLVIETDPQNDDILYVGGVDSYKSTDGGATWTQYTKWSNNNALASANISTVHADQHALVFNPKNPSQFVMGNDGGFFFTSNKNNLVGSNAVQMRNKRFNITQFYHGTLNPVASYNNEEMILGAQDNGTPMLSGAPLANNFYNDSVVYGGDGAFTAYDDQDKYLIASYVYNFHILFHATGTAYLISNSAQQNAGQFINPLVVDRNLDIAYTNANSNGAATISLNRISGLATQPLQLTRSQLTIANTASGENLSRLYVSPYTTTSSTVFIGTTLGKLYKVTTANTTPNVTLFSNVFPGNVSDIKLGASENEIMVVVSNFNVDSVFYSTDGGTSWFSKEGNLPDIPVRAIFMNPENNNEVIVGTHSGVFGTGNFQDPSPTWGRYSNGLGNFKITHFDYRPSDKTILAVSYGRGAFTTRIDNSSMGTGETNHNLLKNKVYPNPTRGPINVKFDSKVSDKVDVEVYDASGKLVFTKKGVKSDEEFFIDSLLKGNYVVKVIQDGKTLYSSAIIKR
ncbi:WD40/YVTN/BNR-like repeat-containing protein [Soonwooa sp.]|uniref:WD40/YVTN/BNR-like repeat-containing protein n=1 Tax=Soonwooa sp. TaxID=1938592 RepID=UPI0028B1FCE6|nr:T9SS type A sorting domain-containing protein [Soonwooa sp.]